MSTWAAECARRDAEATKLRRLLDEATKIGGRLAGLECDSSAEERIEEIREEAGLANDDLDAVIADIEYDRAARFRGIL